MNIGEIYIDTMNGDRYKINKVGSNSAEACSTKYDWDKVTIKKADIDSGRYRLHVENLHTGASNGCFHDWTVYTGFMKKEWYCKKCESFKPYVNEGFNS